MANPNKSTSLQLSADEWRNITKWPDAVIYEIMSMQRSVTYVTNNIINVINEMDGIAVMESRNVAIQTQLKKAIVTTQEQISAMDAVPGQIGSVKRDLRDLQALLLNMQEQLAATDSFLTKITSMKRDILRIGADVPEQLAIFDSVLAKIAGGKRDQQRVNDDLSQQLAAAQARTGFLEAKIKAQSLTLMTLQEQAVIPDSNYLPRLMREVEARMNLEQEFQGS